MISPPKKQTYQQQESPFLSAWRKTIAEYDQKKRFTNRITIGFPHLNLFMKNEAYQREVMSDVTAQKIGEVMEHLATSCYSVCANKKAFNIKKKPSLFGILETEASYPHMHGYISINPEFRDIITEDKIHEFFYEKSVLWMEENLQPDKFAALNLKTVWHDCVDVKIEPKDVAPGDLIYKKDWVGYMFKTYPFFERDYQNLVTNKEVAFNIK